jgi:hypothetical protein
MTTTLTKQSINFGNLPEDMIFIILEYLPIKTRLTILKHKYSRKFWRDKIAALTFKQLYFCANIAKPIVIHYLKYKNKGKIKYPPGISVWYLNAFFNVLQKEKEKCIELYKNCFTLFIDYCLHQYLKKSNKKNQKENIKNDEAMLKLYLQVLLI